MMQLKVLAPMKVFLDIDVRAVTAEAQNGFFSVLPRHIDFVAALVPSLLSYVGEDGREEHLAIDGGIFVKCGQDVLVSTRNAVRGPNIGELRTRIEQEFGVFDKRQRAARAAIARLEANLARRFMELGRHE